MQAIVLAAGEGRRLRPLTAHRPKVMIPVGGRPILEHVIHALVDNGITDIALVTGYHRERILTHFEDGRDFGANITHVHQDRQLGTGHALAAGFDATRPKGPFVVLPGDNYVTPGLVRALVEAKGEAALVTTISPNPSKYGVVEISGHRVERIHEKPAAPATRLISAGIYRLPPSIRTHLEPPDGLVLTDAVNHAIADELEMVSVPTEDAWQDIVYPWDLLTVNHRVLRDLKPRGTEGRTEDGVIMSGPVHVGEGTMLRHGTYIIGPVQIGNGCDIGPNVIIRGPTTIGDHVHIGPFSDLDNVAIFDNVRIDTGAIIRHSVIDDGARLGPRVSADRGPAIFEIEDEFQRIDSLGAVVGQDAFLGANAVLEPGSMIGSGASVAPNRVVHRVPDKGVVA